jgi:hypothetical protein
MKKTIFALAAVATIAAGTLTAPAPAEARCIGCWVGGGIVAGAIAGAAIANSQPRYYAAEPGYVEYRGYNAAYPVDCPGGHWSRRPVAFDAYGRPVAWSRPRFVCP